MKVPCMGFEAIMANSAPSKAAKEIVDNLNAEDDGFLDAFEIRKQEDWSDLAGRVVGAENFLGRPSRIPPDSWPFSIICSVG